MTFTAILILLIISVIFASLGQWLVGFSSAGWVASLIMGIAGAFIGLWAAARFHLPPVIKFYVSTQAFPLVWVTFFIGLFVLISLLVQRAIVRRYS